MRIGIDARFYGPKGKGLGRYAQKLIENLEEVEGNSSRQYFVFLKKDNFALYQPRYGNFTKVLADYHWYTVKEQLFFPFFLRKYDLDLMHFCHFNVPLFYRRRFVATLHDLILFHYPTLRNTTLNARVYKLKLLAYKAVIRFAAKKAEKIIAVSQYTKEDLIKKLKIPEHKIEVTLEGCNGQCFVVPEQKAATVFAKYGIIKPYLLYVGNAYPHKNLDRLCEAFALVRQSHPEISLVLVGGEDFFYKRLSECVKQKAIKGVIFAGYIPDEELDLVYKEAMMYVFPSLYEGFGLPPLEAMAKSTAVVSSDRTSMPEVLADAAVYFDPEKISSMVSAISGLVDSPKERERLSLKGRQRLKHFSWLDMAKKTAKVYLECGNNKKN